MLLYWVSDRFVDIILVQTQCKSAARRPIGIALESLGEVDLGRECSNKYRLSNVLGLTDTIFQSFRG